MLVATEQARAFSADGRHWQLQVAAYPPRGLWSGAGHAAERRWFRFGDWSAQAGLARVPVNPILDVGDMLDAADALVAAVARVEHQVPFTPAAELELWQLDQDGRPLALLDTALAADGLTAQDAPAWSAGGGGERRFHSPTLAAAGERIQTSGAPVDHARALEAVVAQAAGGPGRAVWVAREADGGGRIVAAPAAAGPAPSLAAEDFPALHLREDWPDARTTALVRDYMDWLSPYLLTLPTLDAARRASLERAAVRCPSLVDRLWRLYPSQMDPELIRRARVQARLRSAATD